MTKHFTRRNAAILYWIGAASGGAAILIDGNQTLGVGLALTSVALIYFSMGMTAWRSGFEKGQREALKVEITRVWSEQQPFNVTDAK